MRRIENVLLSCALIVLAGFVFNMGLFVITLINEQLSSGFYITLFVVAFIVAFVIVPVFIIHIFLNLQLNSIFINLFNWKRTIIILIIMVIMSLYSVGYEATTEYLVVAFGEEFLFRHIILLILLRVFRRWCSYIIGSLMFALILHLNGDFIINLLTKFPVSLLLYYVAGKYKLQDAIGLHWLYNVLVYKFS